MRCSLLSIRAGFLLVFVEDDSVGNVGRLEGSLRLGEEPRSGDTKASTGCSSGIVISVPSARGTVVAAARAITRFLLVTRVRCSDLALCLSSCDNVTHVDLSFISLMARCGPRCFPSRSFLGWRCRNSVRRDSLLLFKSCGLARMGGFEFCEGFAFASLRVCFRVKLNVWIVASYRLGI